jgi:hypothetical protein
MAFPANSFKQITSAPGATSVLAAPGASETITATDDLILHLECGATAVTVTLVDGGFTQAGTLGSGVAVSVIANAKVFIAVPPAFASPATGLITVTFSNQTTVTGEWLRM